MLTRAIIAGGVVVGAPRRLRAAVRPQGLASQARAGRPDAAGAHTCGSNRSTCPGSGRGSGRPGRWRRRTCRRRSPDASSSGISGSRRAPRSRAGDLIVRIDPTDYDQRLLASLKRGEALEADLSALEVEEANLRRQVELAQQEEQTASRDYDRAIEADRAGAGSPSEIDLRLGALRRAQRTLETLRQQLGVGPRRGGRGSRHSWPASWRRGGSSKRTSARTSVTSPIDGVLQLVGVEVGRVGLGLADRRSCRGPAADRDPAPPGDVGPGERLGR